ncbi:MAG: anthranilate phosphoribosyltransferase, partial [Candidatus Omnitrophica bacterium]|nr:anthranilate phosphoribosyltransferase [Candidatus Omnitrophota bacterium]
MQAFLDKLQQKKNLTRDQMTSAMTDIMSGRAGEHEVRDFLVLLNAKGPTIEEITAAAMIMRKYVLLIDTDREVVLDTCGTGGDNAHTFNISTMAALVVAGCGVTVAKHGNRSVSSRCGSADVLEALGVNIAFSYGGLKACLEEIGIAFLFAQNHHPAMK